MSDGPDLIDENARRQFESDWVQGKPRAIEEYLPSPDDERYWPTLEELLYIDLEFSWKEFRSKTSAETVSVSKLPTEKLKTISRRFHLEEKPDLWQRLKEYDESLRASRVEPKQEKPVPSQTEIDTRAFSDSLESSVAGEPVSSAEDARSFGGFELMEMLGRGGMGVVFRAREKSTGRLVALKMIRSNVVSQVDEETRQVVLDRFQTEARAVANIEHPNIVTLYSVGEIRSTPYIAMQLVPGEDLASLMRQTVLDGRRAAEYTMKVADAIDSAHRKGIIHRDIKPHNILLDSEKNEPLITDFGLAKLTEEADGVTMTGELLGTPAYMSPEQAARKPVDRASDIYSLGATLYALVGGRAPFQSADTLKTIEQIIRNPPVALREVNPDIDRDLETICLKCLEKDPERRYATAGELRDDLGRYLNGEPISARPVGTIEKSYRWCRRNPLPTTIMVAVTLIAVLSVTGMAWINSLAKRNETLATKNLANSNLAFESNRRELFVVTGDESLKQPAMRSTRESLLLPLRDFFEQFIDTNREFAEQNPDVHAEYAFAHFAIGKIATELDDFGSAMEHLNQAIRLQMALTEKNANDLRARLDLSNSLNLRGECQVKTGQRESSRADFDQALQIRKSLVNASPENVEYRRRLINTEMNLGNWFAYAGNPESLEKSVERYRQALAMRGKLLADHSLSKKMRYRLAYDQAKCQFDIAASLTELDREAEAKKYAKDAFAGFKDLVQQRPEDFLVRRDKIRCSQLLSNLAKDNPYPWIAEIADEYLNLVAFFPREAEYRWLAAEALFELVDLALGERDVLAARQALEKAFEVIEKKDPASVDHKLLVVRLSLASIPVLLDDSNLELAKSRLSSAKKLLDSIDEKSDELDELNQRYQALLSVVNSISGPK